MMLNKDFFLDFSKENGFKIDTLGMFSPIIGKKTTVDPIITIYC